MGGQVDWTEFLPAIRVPTLVLHRTGDQFVAVAEGRRLAEGISSTKYVEARGRRSPSSGRATRTRVVAEIQAFLHGIEAGRRARPHSHDDSCVTDIVGSTEEAAAHAGDAVDGDKLQRRARQRSFGPCLRSIEAGRSQTAGDSFLAIVRRSRAWQSVAPRRSATRSTPLGLSIRVGLHTGECELVPGGIRGLAVNIAARVSALAASGRSARVEHRQGSRRGLGDRASSRTAIHELKGVPGEWRVFRVQG